MWMQQSFFVLALSAGVVSSAPARTAQPVPAPRTVSTFATQRELQARFHRLWLRADRSSNEWDRGLWMRGPKLASDYAHRAALVRFMRTELVPYLASERTVVYPVANAVFGRSHLTARAIADSRAIEGLVVRLDAAARSGNTRSFRANGKKLRVVVDDYFARDHRVIQQLLVLGTRTDAKRVAIAGR